MSVVCYIYGFVNVFYSAAVQNLHVFYKLLWYSVIIPELCAKALQIIR